MTSVGGWFQSLADEVADWGELATLYVRQGDDLMAVRSASGRPRRLDGASALVRTLSEHPATLVGGAPSAEPFARALLEELGTEAALLVRDCDELVAIACLDDLREAHLPLDEENASRIASHCAAGLRSLAPTAVHDALHPHRFRTLMGTFLSILR